MVDADPKLYEHMTQRERMTLGYPYDCHSEEMAIYRHENRRLMKQLSKINESDKDGRREILKQILHPNCSKLENLVIKPGFRVDYGFNIIVGENCYINYNATLLDVCPITIGKNFKAGPCVNIYTAAHPLDPIKRRTIDFAIPIVIGDDVWIGGMSVICPGVTIGNGVTVGAGSVVTKDVPDNCVVVGRPAKVIKTLDRDSIRNMTN